MDENVEHEVARRLENYGHDFTHVDFVHLVEREMFHSVLYITDQTLSTDQLADAVHRVSQYYLQSELNGLEYLILPAVTIRRSSPHRGGDILHGITAGSISSERL